ncbi:hypothetical protein Gotri_023828 [Gossypium trilobum]|uniref:Uncharacterized protein n=1 Tax=Gossypium trilobum TaxID=34281 RepID=A0A7J9DK99_9ROSI|nr:hypothetical protein [Gossypium trilobum]
MEKIKTHQDCQSIYYI